MLADPSVVDDAAVLRSVAARLGRRLVVAPVADARRARPPRLAAPGCGLPRHPRLTPRRPAPGCLHGSGRMTPMAMTAKVKDELSRLEVTKPCCRKAEVCGIGEELPAQLGVARDRLGPQQRLRLPDQRPAR